LCSSSAGGAPSERRRPRTVSDFTGKQITITPTADGLPAAETLGTTGDTVSTTYDNTDSPAAIKLANNSSTLQSFTYSDGPVGDILSESDTPSSPKSPAVYTYDPQNRVTSMTPGTGTAAAYGFDASGNLTTLPTGASGTYDHDGELTSSTLPGTATSYGYDADGQRLTAKQGSTTVAASTSNGDGRLTAYDNSAADMTTASYDGLGLRAAATSTPSGGSATAQDFVWDNDPSVPRLLMDSANAYISIGGPAPAEQVNLA
jgi:YD repeat-containing protein